MTHATNHIKISTIFNLYLSLKYISSLELYPVLEIIFVFFLNVSNKVFKKILYPDYKNLFFIYLFIFSKFLVLLSKQQ